MNPTKPLFQPSKVICLDFYLLECNLKSKEFAVGSLPCSEKLFSGYSGFLLSSKPTLPNSNSIWNARTRLNEFIRNPKCFVGKQITIQYNTNDLLKAQDKAKKCYF